MSEGEAQGRDTARGGRVWRRLRGRMALPALLLVALAVTIPLDDDYGFTYDEGWWTRTAQLARMWFRELAARPGYALSDEGIRRYWDASVHHQPGTVQVVGGLTSLLLGFLPAVYALRATTAVFLCIGMAALYAFARRAFGPAEACFACLALLTMPRVFAHAHFLTLDVPVMSMSFAALYLAWRAAETGTWGRAVAAGACFGAAACTKVNGFFVAVILLLVAPLWVFSCSGWRRGYRAERRREAIIRAGKVAASLVLVGPVAFYILWPWVWHDTWRRVRDDYLAFHYKHYRVGTYYFGKEYPPPGETGPPAPWHYPFVMTGLTTPGLTLVLALFGMGSSWRLARKLHLPTLLLLIGIGVNFAFSALPSSPKYGGVRLFLPVFPFLAAFAGRGFRRLVAPLMARLSEAPQRVRATYYVGLGALLLTPAMRGVATYYPHHLSYYNEIIGGAKGAVARGLPATYWGEPLLEAALYVANKAPKGATVWVAPPGMVSIVQMYQFPNLKIVDGVSPPLGATYAMFALKPNEIGYEGCQSLLAQVQLGLAKPEYTVESVGGVPLAYVFGPRAVRRTQTQRLLRPSLPRPRHPPEKAR